MSQFKNDGDCEHCGNAKTWVGSMMNGSLKCPLEHLHTSHSEEAIGYHLDFKEKADQVVISNTHEYWCESIVSVWGLCDCGLISQCPHSQYDINLFKTTGQKQGKYIGKAEIITRWRAAYTLAHRVWCDAATTPGNHCNCGHDLNSPVTIPPYRSIEDYELRYYGTPYPSPPVGAAVQPVPTAPAPWSP